MQEALSTDNETKCRLSCSPCPGWNGRLRAIAEKSAANYRLLLAGGRERKTIDTCSSAPSANDLRSFIDRDFDLMAPHIGEAEGCCKGRLGYRSAAGCGGVRGDRLEPEEPRAGRGPRPVVFQGEGRGGGEGKSLVLSTSRPRSSHPCSRRNREHTPIRRARSPEGGAGGGRCYPSCLLRIMGSKPHSVQRHAHRVAPPTTSRTHVAAMISSRDRPRTATTARRSK